MMMASDQVKAQTTDGCSDIGAEDFIGCTSTRTDRSSSAVGCIVNERNGSKIA